MIKVDASHSIALSRPKAVADLIPDGDQRYDPRPGCRLVETLDGRSANRETDPVQVL
jgi:hypothetical protein